MLTPERAGIALMVRIPYVRFIPVFSTDFLNQAKYEPQPSP